MPEYTLYFTQTASSSVTVQADDLEAAENAAYDLLPTGVCAQCAGWGRAAGVELSGDWELDEKAARDDYPDEQ